MRSPLTSSTRSLPRRLRANRARRVTLECLEGRELLATVSISNASMNEIGSPSSFVATGSGGLDAPIGMALGPDGNVYVACNGGAVRRYNGTTGQYISTFVAPGSGGLSTVNGLTFGPDGNLYIPSGDTDQVLRYNGTTGAFMGVFISAGSGGLDLPRTVTFGPDGNVYVSSLGTNSVMRYQGLGSASPGAPLPAAGQTGATFIPANSGGMLGPLYILFGPDGKLYVDGAAALGVGRFDASTGAFIDTFVPSGRGDLAGGRAMVFDQDGRLYVTDSGNGVHRYDPQGNFIGDLLVNSVSPALSKPLGMIFDAQGALLISARDNDNVVRYDRGVVVSLSAPSATPVSVDYTTVDGTATAGDYSTQSGTVTFAPGQTSRRILLATQDDLSSEPAEAFTVQLSNPTGATLGNANATVTIVDDDSTRQLNISDTSSVEGDHAAHYRGAFAQGIPGNGLSFPTFGPDGNLYVSGNTGPGGSGIDRYDGTTGAFIDTFVARGQPFQSRDTVFRGDYFYVACEMTNDVRRFDAMTGAFVDVFVTPGSGGINGPHGMTFGPDANGDGVPELYVSGRNSFSVVRYDGATGQPLGTYVTSGSGGMSWPEGITFDPTGTYLYVANSGSNQVGKYNAQTGTYVGVVTGTGLVSPRDVKFGPDGLMYVASGGNSRIERFNASGTYVDDYVPAGSGGMPSVSLNRLVFGPDGDLYVSAVGVEAGQIFRFGTESEALFTVTLSTPSTLPVTVSYSIASGTALAGSDYVATSGTLTFAPGVTSETIRVATLDDTVGEPNETFTLNLSSPIGATIADGQGVVTILDNETKFFVVDDATSNSTFEYGSGGASVENYTLNSGNTAPRGAASTAAGDKVWVVDANKKVYVYNTSGGLLGSWTAGTLASNATVEGIATDGNDVWIVDARNDSVYRYTGAASRLAGSQNAASSFALNGSNTSPKDVVTDGTNLWVVNDSTTDKVFRYTLSGSLAGSWTITGAGSSPTGITLDPSGGGALWVVDNGSDRVYQFDNARSRTSGSQSPSTSFALAAGNANPQGIADPPVPTPGAARATAFTTTLHPAPQLAAHLGKTTPRLSASKSSGSPLSTTSATFTIPGPQGPSILIPLTPSTDQDVTLLATERLLTGAKRSRTAPRV